MQPLLLLTNDDGIHAPGLERLRQALAGLGQLVLCAPMENHSGRGAAITVDRVVAGHRLPAGPEGERRYAVDGTPADAAQYALRNVFRDQPPRLLVSGINHGANIGCNVRYSGTIGAALEGAWNGVPSLAVSVDYTEPPLWEAAMHYTRLVAERLLAKPHAPRAPLLYNLNVPAVGLDEIKGIRVTRHGLSGYEEFVADDGGQPTVALRHRDTDPASDGATLQAGYASLTPLALDQTDHEAFDRLSALDWNA